MRDAKRRFRLRLPKKRRLGVIMAAVLFGAAIVAAPLGALAAGGQEGSIRDEVRIAVLSDMHYYPVNFVSDCADYTTYVGGDPKMLEESGSIADAALEMVREDAPDVLVVSGDLTKDGEIQGHRDLAAKFQELEDETDTEVFVINGNHDVYNYTDACTFENGRKESAQTTTPEEFRQIYENFGYNGDFGATYFTNPVTGEQAGGLSYAVDLGDFTLVAIDSCMYSPDAGTGYDTNEHVTAGRVDEDLLPWVTERMREAEAEGDTVIGLMHHGLVPHFEGEENILSEYVVEDWRDVATAFADAGMRYIFTGHMHANDIAEYTTVSGNHITDLETGSLSSWRSPLRTVTLTKGEPLGDGTARTHETFEVSSRGVASIDFTDHTGATTHIEDFLAYTQQKLYPETLFNNMANGMLRPVLQEIGEQGLRPWLAENLPDVDIDALVLDAVPGLLEGGMDIELGTGIGRVHVEYRNGGIQLQPSGTAGIIGDMTITDAQLLEIVYDVLDKIETRYIDNPDWLLGKVDEIVTKVSNYGLTSLDAEEKTIYDLVFVILTGHYAGSENPPAWTEAAVATIEQGDIFGTLINDLLDDLMPILDDVLANTSIDTSIAFSGLWKTAIDSVTDNGNLKATLETFGFDETAIRELIDGLINEYMSPSFLTGMGSLVGNICDSMLYDTNGADDVIGGEGRTIVFDGTTEKPEPSVENGLLPTQVTMTLGESEETSRNFRWYTGTNVSSGVVQVASDADFQNVVAEEIAVSEEVVKPQTHLNLGLVATYGTQRATRHSATIQGLDENSDYFYRVGDKGNGYWSDAIPFVTGGETDDADTFSFISVNDSQGMVESDYDVYLSTLAQARQAFPDAAFTIHGGDFVDDGANEDYWTWALDDEDNVAQGMAMAPAAGNHEAKSDVEGITDENPIVSHFNLSGVADGQDLSTGAYYSFEYKNATFVVLNTNDLGANGGISQEQYDWAYQTLSAADTQWKIVLLHKSPYSNGPHQADEDVVAIRSQMDALAASCDVDVVLSGHDHVYNRTPYLMRGEQQDVATETQAYQGTNYETAVNPNGTVFIIAGTCGVKNYVQDTSGGIPSQVALDLSVPVYTGFTIDGDHLYYRAYSVSDGASTLVDSFAISKAEDETPAWKEVEDQIAALPEQSEVTTADKAAIEAARAAYDALSAEDQRQVSNLDRLIAAENMLELLESVAGKRTVTVTNHDDFTSAINDSGVGTIITQGTIEFDEGGLFDDGDREIYVRRDVVVRGTGELRFCRFHVESGATLVLADSVYVNDTRSQGSMYDALNPVEVNAGGTLITQDSVSLRTEYGTGGDDNGVAVKLMGTGATAILGSSGTYWGAEAAVLSTASGTTLVINDGTYNAKNNNRVVIDTHGDATVNGGTVSSMWISGTLRVNGGTFEHQDSASSDWTPLAISGGNAYITGGTFETYGGRDGTASIKLENNARLHVLADANGSVRIGSVNAYVGNPSTSNYRDVKLGYLKANGWGDSDGIYRVEGAVSASSVEDLAALSAERLSTSAVSDSGDYMTTTLPDGTSTVFGKYWLYGGGKGAPTGSGIIGSGEVVVYGPTRTIKNNPVTGVTIDGDATRLVDLNQEGAGTLRLTGYTTPADAFDNGITWGSDNEQTASVEERNGQGVVSIKQAGGANITATSDSKPGLSDSVEVIAVSPELEGPETLDEETSTATYTASKGFESDAYDSRLTWRYSVNDQTLATIDAEAGTLTKLKPGTVTVTATLCLDGESTDVSVSKDVVLRAVPETPDVDDVNALLDVQVSDANEGTASAHDVKTFLELIANSEGENDSYEIGDVYAEDAAVANPIEAFANFFGITRAARVYKVDVTIKAAPYVAAFDEALGLEAGTHEVKGDESKTVTLVWGDGDPSAEPEVAAGWTLADTGATPVVFQVMCRGAQAAPTLTVTPGSEHATVTVTGADGAQLYGDIQWSDYDTDWAAGTFQTLQPGTNTLEVSSGGTFYIRAAGDATHDPSEVASVTINKVTFKVNEGEGSFSEGSPTTWYLESGEAVGADNMPSVTRDGYVFAGWETEDGAAFDGATTVAKETTVIAQWTKLAAITVEPDEGNAAYTYDGDAKEFAFATDPEGVSGFTVEYRASGSSDDAAWTAEAPSDAGTYDVRVTREADDAYAAFAQVFEDGLIIARAAQDAPTVTYAMGGSTITALLAPRDGFFEWSTGEDFADAQDVDGHQLPISDSGVFYVRAKADSNHEAGTAKAITIVKVTFDDNDGVAGVDETENAAFTTGGPTVLLAARQSVSSLMPKVAWDGYDFVRWAKADGTEFKSTSLVTEDVTVTAEWRARTYTVTFDPAGGVLAEGEGSREVALGSALGELPVPTRADHLFDGWFTAAQDGEKIDESTTLSTPGDVTYYAHWTLDPDSLRVTLTLDAGEGGFEGGQGTTTVELAKGGSVSSADLAAPSRDGFAFAGWYLDEQLSAPVVSVEDATEDVPATVFGEDATLHARWIEDLSADVTVGKVETSYTGRPVSAVPSYGDGFPEAERANVAVSYRECGADEGAWSDAAPVGAGTYDVRLSYAGTEDYGAFELVFEEVIAISPAQLFASDLTADPVEIEAGTALADVGIVGGTVTMADGTVVPGTWGWVDAASVVSETGSYAAVFTPEGDEGNFLPLTADLQLTVKDAGDPDEPGTDPDGPSTDPDDPAGDPDEPGAEPDDPDVSPDDPSGGSQDDQGTQGGSVNGGGQQQGSVPSGRIPATDDPSLAPGSTMVLAGAALSLLGAWALRRWD